jgi:integrase
MFVIIGYKARIMASDTLETQPPEPPALPDAPAPPANAGSGVPAHLQGLAETARNYARGAKAKNTQRAYASDWKQFEAWCRRRGLDLGLNDPDLSALSGALAPDPQVVGLYLAACASATTPVPGRKPVSVRTLERRLSAIAWFYAQRGTPLDRADRHIAEVMKGIRRQHGRPPDHKEAVLAEDLLRMIETLPRDLRGLRDRAILLIGFAGALRRSEIVGLDCGPDQTEDGAGWLEILDQGALLHVRGKTGWREVEIGRGSSDLTCPVKALETWLKLARVAHGPLFRGLARGGKTVGPDRLADKHVARLVKRTALAAGLRSDLAEGVRRGKFSGHSLRAGLATAAEVDERYVQKHLGHASAEMTRRYQRRRERFRVNLTKAAGL